MKNLFAGIKVAMRTIIILYGLLHPDFSKAITCEQILHQVKAQLNERKEIQAGEWALINKHTLFHSRNETERERYLSKIGIPHGWPTVIVQVSSVSGETANVLFYEPIFEYPGNKIGHRMHSASVPIVKLAPLPSAASQPLFDLATETIFSADIEKPAFLPGDKVRIRERETNLILNATVVETSASSTTITIDGETYSIENAAISKIHGNFPAKNFMQISRTRFVNFGANLSKLFDSAARITSSVEFARMKEEEKVKIVVEFGKLFFIDDNAPAYATVYDSPEDIICRGHGVCSHKAFVLGNIFSEAGVDANFILSYSDNDYDSSSYGHAWLEVRFARKNYIIDLGKEFGKVRDYYTLEDLYEYSTHPIVAKFYNSNNKLKIAPIEVNSVLNETDL